MTRINAGIIPQALIDQHLRAEYREIARVSTQLKKLGSRKPNIPAAFKLGPGHQSFFLNKGKYLVERYQQLIDEMEVRGFNVGHPTYRVEPWNDRPEFFLNWDDTSAHLPLAERISVSVNRMKSEPMFNGKKIDRQVAIDAVLLNKPLSLLITKSTK